MSLLSRTRSALKRLFPGLSGSSAPSARPCGSAQASNCAPGTPSLVVAVSGGADSTALLDLLDRIAKREDFGLVVAHLDHGFRKAGRREAEWVRRFGEARGWPTEVAAVDVPGRRRKGESPQEAARRIRYDFLAAVARRHRAQAIAVAHTADDQAETFLLRLIRGAARRGLASIPPLRSLEEADGAGTGAIPVIRPLLEVRRKEIVRYLKVRKIRWIEDPSNHKDRYLRNRVRHRLLPLLRRMNPRIVETLCREAETLREEEEVLTEETFRALRYVMLTCEAGRVVLDAAKLGRRLPALRRRLLRWGIERARSFDYAPVSNGTDAPGAPGPLSRRHLEAADGILYGRGGRRVDLPGASVRSEYGKWIAEAKGVSGSAPQEGYDLPLAVPGETQIPNRARIIVQRNGATAPGRGLRVDPDKSGLPLRVRSRRPGDRFHPVGMTGTKKLQDLFVDAKIPRSERDRIPIVYSPRGIVWVAGVRADRRFIGEGKRSILLRYLPADARAG